MSELDEAITVAARELRSDRERGAMQLAARAVALLPALLRNDAARDVRTVVRALAAARPSMVSIANAVALCAAPLVRGEIEGEAFAAHANRLLTCWAREGEVVTAEAQKHIPKVILTYSNASTTRAALLARKAHLTSVVIPEGRPIDDGKKLATTLAAAGIPVVTITEAQFGAWVPQVEAVIVGADTVGPDGGVYNHIGTATLALLAREHRVPVLSLTHTLKVAPFDRPEDTAEENDPDEIWAHPPAGVTVRNLTFDRTPPNRITVITERGVLTDTLRAEVVAAHAEAWRMCGLST